MESTPQHAGEPVRLTDHKAVQALRVRPGDVTESGFVRAGAVLESIHAVANSVATSWSRRHCVTASAGNIDIGRPIRSDERVTVHGHLIYTKDSTMDVLVTVSLEAAADTGQEQITQCSIVFVAVDNRGGPVPVRPWKPMSMLELQRQRQARVRMRIRDRIESAMVGEPSTAAGPAPRARLRFAAGRGERLCGAMVMRWIDEAACLLGAQWTGDDVMTSYVAGIWFDPTEVWVRAVEVVAQLIYTGGRSVHCAVDIRAGARSLARAVVVVEAPDRHDAVRSVREWVPLDDDGRRFQRHARHLIEMRQFIEPFSAWTTLSDDFNGTVDPVVSHPVGAQSDSSRWAAFPPAQSA